MEKDYFERRDLPLTDRSPDSASAQSSRESSGNDCGCDHGEADRAEIRTDRSAGGEDACTCHGYEGCCEGSWGLSEHPLAMVYAPCQYFRAMYDPCTALSRGTLFTELDLPLGGTDGGAFTTSGACCRRNSTP